MQHVQSNLENVVSLLLRLAPTNLPAGSQASTDLARHNSMSGNVLSLVLLGD